MDGVRVEDGWWGRGGWWVRWGGLVGVAEVGGEVGVWVFLWYCLYSVVCTLSYTL